MDEHNQSFQQPPVQQPMHEEQLPEHPHHVSNKPIIVSLLFLAVLLIGGIIYFTFHPRPPVEDSIPDKLASTITPKVTDLPDVDWMFDGNEWHASSTPPNCPEPSDLVSPVDLQLVSAILYPGQTRGNDYKPHGGFLFAGHDNEEITVHAPMDGRLIAGSRYKEQGEVQNLLLFVNNCGIAYRFDHLLTLTPKIQEAINTLPEAVPNDSRTTSFANPVIVKKGNPIATAVGFKNNKNVSVDFGVYDLRKKNLSASDAAYVQAHNAIKEQADYAVCWLDLLPDDQKAKVKSLPGGDALAGKTSDYCK